MNRVEELKNLIKFHTQQLRFLEIELDELQGNELLAPYGFRLYTPYQLTEKFYEAFPKVIAKIVSIEHVENDSALLKFEGIERKMLFELDLLKELLCP